MIAEDFVVPSGHAQPLVQTAQQVLGLLVVAPHAPLGLPGPRRSGCRC